MFCDPVCIAKTRQESVLSKIYMRTDTKEHISTQVSLGRELLILVFGDDGNLLHCDPKFYRTVLLIIKLIVEIYKV